MDWTAFIVVIAGTLLFFGFAAWMAIISRRNPGANEQNETE